QEALRRYEPGAQGARDRQDTRARRHRDFGLTLTRGLRRVPRGGCEALDAPREGFGSEARLKFLAEHRVHVAARLHAGGEELLGEFLATRAAGGRARAVCGVEDLLHQLL